MALTTGVKIATVVLVLGATGSGISLVSRAAGPGAVAGPKILMLAQDSPKKIDSKLAGTRTTPATEGDGKTYKIKPGAFRPAVAERGNLEPPQSRPLINRVQGQTTVLSIVPEGTQVKKGDLICELDSADLRDRLTNQRITTQEKEAAVQNAKLARETAEIAVTQYVDGILTQEVGNLKREIAVAESANEKAKSRLERTRLVARKVKELLAPTAKVASPADLVAGLDIEDRLQDAEQRTLFDEATLATARGKLEVLQKYTRPKTVKELTNEVEKVRAVEISQKQTLVLEKSKEAKLEKQISECKIYSPTDGTVTKGFKIEEGTVVVEGQQICLVMNLGGPMQITIKIPENLVGQIRTKQSAQIRVDAVPGIVMKGEVVEISPFPLPGGREIDKRYTSLIRFDQTTQGLKPGMTADVEIVTGELQNVLSVPKKALVKRGMQNLVAVVMPNGTIEIRDVAVGRSNAQYVEIREGLRDGETVLIDRQGFGGFGRGRDDEGFGGFGRGLR